VWIVEAFRDAVGMLILLESISQSTFGSLMPFAYPNNQEISNLPPHLGPFPLFQVSDYAKSLPADMVAKGGLFFPSIARHGLTPSCHKVSGLG
jgi:hypothetical protein